MDRNDNIIGHRCVCCDDSTERPISCVGKKYFTKNKPLITCEAVLSETCFLLNRYENMPASLADACLVRMSEIYPNSKVMTLDSDFLIYRKLRHQYIPVISPFINS